MSVVVHLACVLIHMTECLLPVAKLQLPWVAGILHPCCECSQTLETWTELCRYDSLLGSAASGFFSERWDCSRLEGRLQSLFSLCSVACSVFCVSLSTIWQVFSIFPPTCTKRNCCSHFHALKRCCGFMMLPSPSLHKPMCGMYSYCFVGSLTLHRCRANLGPGIKTSF